MTRTLLWLVFFCLHAACMRATAPSEIREPIKVEVRPYRYMDREMEYWVGTPRDLDPSGPVVVFLEGDGSLCQPFIPRVWDGFLRKYAEGFALVRPKAHFNMVCETPEFRRTDFLHRVDDTIALVDALRTHEPGRPIFLLGQSAGADVALRTLERRPQAITGIVNLGGGVDELSEIMRALRRLKAERAGEDPSLALARFERMLDEVRAHSESDAPFRTRSYRFWHQMLFSGIGKRWRAIDAPAFVGHGLEDFESVPGSMVAASAKELGANPNVTVKLYSGKGHDLLDADVLSDVREWMRNVVQSRKHAAPRE